MEIRERRQIGQANFFREVFCARSAPISRIDRVFLTGYIYAYIYPYIIITLIVCDMSELTVKKLEGILTWEFLQSTDPFKYCALGYVRLPAPQLASHIKLPQ